MRRVRATVLAVVACGACSQPVRTPSTAGAAVTPAGLYEMAERYERRGDSTRAEQYAALAVAQGFPEERAIGLLVGSCLGTNRPRSALAYAEPYARRHPEELRLRILIAAIRVALSEWHEARRELEPLVLDDPANALSHYLLGVVLRDGFAEYRLAAAQLSAYLRLEPGGTHAGEARALLARTLATEPGRQTKRRPGATLDTADRLRADPRRSARATRAAPR